MALDPPRPEWLLDYGVSGLPAGEQRPSPSPADSFHGLSLPLMFQPISFSIFECAQGERGSFFDPITAPHPFQARCERVTSAASVANPTFPDLGCAQSAPALPH